MASTAPLMTSTILAFEFVGGIEKYGGMCKSSDRQLRAETLIPVEGSPQDSGRRRHGARWP